MKKILLITFVSSAFLFIGCSYNTEHNNKDVKAYAKFVPEREDDFAWENDLVAFRMYGPASKATGPASGVDCWLKRVDYSILDKWYDNYNNNISYHTDWGEGYDPYHVGNSRGCGGTALWIDGKPYPAGTFKAWRIIENTKQQVRFELDYSWETDLGQVKETKEITLNLGSQLYSVEATYLLNNQPANNLSIAIGLSTHNGEASVASDDKSAWISTWELIDGYNLGTGAMVSLELLDEIVKRPSKNKDESHIWLISHTDEQGKFQYSAGYAWERAGRIASEQQWHRYLQNYTLLAFP